jgi:hypothetical protein
MDTTTILAVLALVWLACRVRGLEARVAVAEARVLTAECDTGTERAGRVTAEYRALLLEVEVMRLRQAGRDLDAALRHGVAAQVAALPHMRTPATDAIPEIVRRMIGDGRS